MVIRCERCSTMYELDESLLAPTGSEVQCTKCEHVFTAYPPSSAGRTLVGVPAQPPPPPPVVAPAAPSEPPAPPAAPAEAETAEAPAAPRSVGAATSRSNGGAAPRPVRSGAPAVYRPQGAASAAAPVPRAPVLRRDTVGTFEARLRWSNRVRWLAPLAAVGLLVLIAAGWALLGRQGDAGAERTRTEALALLALDDGASVEDAVSRLGAVVNKRPKLRAAAADRALALVVRAAVTAEEGDAISARAAELREDRERARRDQGPGWQEVERTASAEVSRLEPQLRAREDQARALTSGARDQLSVVQAEAGETPEVLRAVALLHALTGERDRLQRAVRTARDRGLRDPWLELADGWSDARDPERAARERALVKLGALAAARPDLLRGRYLLARAQASLGRKAEALATAEGVLAANPAHGGARRLREELAARPAPEPPVAQPAAAPPEAPAAAPPENPPPRRRKSVSQPAPASSDAPAGGAATEPPPSPAPAAPAPEGSGPAESPSRGDAGPPAAGAPAVPPAPEPVEPPPSPPPSRSRSRTPGPPPPGTEGG